MASYKELFRAFIKGRRGTGKRTETSRPASITIVSDLHLETPKSRPSYGDFVLEPQSRFLALLGDIGVATDDGLFAFVELQLQQFERVFYVLGNHEPYDSDHATTKQRFRRLEEKHPGRFYLLDQKRHDLTPAITILGCTLFSAIDAAQATGVSMFVTDFARIRDWAVERHNAAHQADLKWLNETVARVNTEEPHRQILIFTHYAPTILPQAHDPRHLKDDTGVRSAFMTDLSGEVCWASSNVRLWAFGHTHHNCDFADPTTGKRVIANQKGYRRTEAVDFDPGKVITFD